MLPEGADLSTAKASFNNGVLEITVQVPHREARGSRLEIQDTSGMREQPQAIAA
jgi:HSP20 family molecular chaperone IbpA